MTTTTHRSTRPGHARQPRSTRGRAPAPAAAKTKLTSPWASLSRVAHRGPVDHPDVRPARHLVPARARDQDHGWWTFFTDPQFTLENYKEVLARRAAALRTLFINSLRHHDPVGDHPARPGAAGGVRLRLDRVPGPRHAVRRGLRAADRADPGDADPAADPVRRRGPGRHVLDRSGSRTPSSPCRWRSSCCTTS